MGKTADAIEDGIAIAAGAARMSGEDHILVSAVRGDGPFHRERVGRSALTTARLLCESRGIPMTASVDKLEADSMPAADLYALLDELARLADEQARAAKHMRRQRQKAAVTVGRSLGTHEYVSRDRYNLRKRQKQYEGVAARLKEFAGDPIQVESLVEQARDLAWYDLQANIERRLDLLAHRPQNEPGYAEQREERLDALTTVDLAQLDEERRRQLKALGKEIRLASGAVDLPRDADS